MKSMTRWLPLLAAALLCGCLQVEDDLTLNADGSGTVKMKVVQDLPETLSAMFNSESRSPENSMYPPTDESEVNYYFPRKDFEVTSSQQPSDKGKVLTIEARFKDVNKLLASPYAHAHQLVLKTNNGVLVLQALTGASTIVHTAQVQPEGEMAQLAPPGIDEARKKSDQMRFQFSVTLPGPITEANGARDNNTVRWDVRRDKAASDEEFADKVAGLLEAKCSAANLRVALETPPRLGLVPFNQLEVHKVTSTVVVPDTNKVIAAAKFIPRQLRVTRSIDLSGEGRRESQSQLTGSILLPAEFAPQKWGKPTLEEVTDGSGKSLLPKEGEESSFTRYSRFIGDDYEDEMGEPKDSEPASKPRVVTLSFAAPDWKVKSIERIVGSVEMSYPGGAEIIKISNAVPAKLIKEMGKNPESFQFDSENGAISDPALDRLGLKLSVEMAMVQNGMTMISLSSEGAGTLTDAQVFDSAGKPWPTTLIAQRADSDGPQMVQVGVAGKPKGPLSMAFQVGGVGATIKLPIRVENVPVGESK